MQCTNWERTASALKRQLKQIPCIRVRSGRRRSMSVFPIGKTVRRLGCKSGFHASPEFALSAEDGIRSRVFGWH